jgi:hypothetical protein
MPTITAPLDTAKLIMAWSWKAAVLRGAGGFVMRSLWPARRSGA